MEVLKAIRKFLPEGAQLHAQVVSLTAEKMVDEAHHMLEVLGRDTFIKVPVTSEGIKSMKLLKKENANITATPDVIEVLIKHYATTNAVDVFTRDFYSLVGEGSTMKNL